MIKINKEPLDAFELRLGFDQDWTWKFKEIYENKLKHYNALSIDQKSI